MACSYQSRTQITAFTDARQSPRDGVAHRLGKPAWEEALPQPVNNAGEAIQSGTLLYRRLATCGSRKKQAGWRFLHAADCQSAIRQSATLRYLGRGLATLRPSRLSGFPRFWLPLVLLSFAFASGAFAQSPATNAAIRFRTVDVFVDSKDKPLAAYQLEFAVTNTSAKIVGIEGGEHPAFAQPPFYDPKAMQRERVILAAFSTEAADKLPKGKTRVARIHIQSSGTAEVHFETKLQTAAGADGKKLQAAVSSEERKTE